VTQAGRAPDRPSLTDTLCTRCGLCCDGTLFADVELAGPGEATGLEVMGLEIEDGGAGAAVLVLPCAALAKRRCGVYAHRPACCREFECRLLQDTRRGAVAVARAWQQVARAHAQIRRVKALLARLETRGNPHLPLKERCTDALAGGKAATPAETRTRARLEAAMTAVERTIRTTFLGPGSRRT
jgi:Fe-S-cluster containining protein